MRTRPFEQTISLAEARAIIDGALRPVERAERVPLSQANGRVVAQSVVSDRDVPPFSRAGMDGYALQADDTTGATRATPRTLSCTEEIFTGQMPARSIAAGTCAAVATGAPMPAGADAVVMVEDTEIRGHDVHVCAAVTAGQNVGRQGADIGAGEAVFDQGTALNPSRVGALAALGRSHVDVFARPRVAILSTGDEIVEPGHPLAPGQLYDINRFTLGAVISEHGGEAITYRATGDTLEHLSRALDACAEADVVVFSGGSSVGERDLVLDAIAARGEVLFHGIAVKPGKPTAFGRIDNRIVFGMPGYPTSCLSNAYILLVPAIRRLARLPPHLTRAVKMPIGAPVKPTPGRHQFLTVRLEHGAAMPVFKGSGDITSMSRADGYIEIPAKSDPLAAGAMVAVTLF